MHRFYDSRLERELITLQPGEVYVSDRDELVYTVLGSCVSVCLFDDVNCIGGINHYRLSTPTESGVSNAPGPTQYGDAALLELLEKMRMKGALASLLKAKIFGGATMSPGSVAPNPLALENIAVADRFLETHGIEKVSENTGGHLGRRLLFHTASGMVLMQPVTKARPKTPSPLAFGDAGSTVGQGQYRKVELER